MTQATNRLEINLMPLLDLVLQLIMFFMLTANFVRMEQVNEGVDLPVAQSALPLKNSDDNLLYIHIGPNGDRFAAGAKLDTAVQLRDYLQTGKAEIDRLARVHGLTGSAPIVIVVRADKDASWGRVSDTLDECNRAGFRSWQMRVIKQAV